MKKKINEGKGIFNPVDHTDAKVREWKFENQIEMWLDEKGRQENSLQGLRATITDTQRTTTIYSTITM